MIAINIPMEKKSTLENRLFKKTVNLKFKAIKFNNETSIANQRSKAFWNKAKKRKREGKL